MPPIARKDDPTSCPLTEVFIAPVVVSPYGPGPIVPSSNLPHVGGPLQNVMPVCLEINGKPVIRLGDQATCIVGGVDNVMTGAAKLTVCGIPVARVGDIMAHTGTIATGSPNVDVGGPSFALPATITIQGPASFRNQVIRDMYMLSTTPSGKAIIDQIAATGRNVQIVPETNPHNSFASPAHSNDDYKNGTGDDSIVRYNPFVAAYVYDSALNKIDEPPQVILAHELAHALHNATGTNATNDPDPVGAVGEPKIKREEAQAIGVGSYTATYPSENSLRRDLGLPERANHGGWIGDKAKRHVVDVSLFGLEIWGHDEDYLQNEVIHPTGDLRPGAC